MRPASLRLVFGREFGGIPCASAVIAPFADEFIDRNRPPLRLVETQVIVSVGCPFSKVQPGDAGINGEMREATVSAF